MAAAALRRASSFSSSWSVSRHRRHLLCLRDSIHAFSSAAAVAAEPSDDAANLIPGCADQAGTSRYAQRFASAAGADHFRQINVGGKVGELTLSSIGVGTLSGKETEAVDRDYIQAITRCFQLGINFVDTASNYRSMRSERAIGRCLSSVISQGIIQRNEVIISTKGGFLSFDHREKIDPRTYIEEKYVKTGLFKWEEFLGGAHCLSTPFVMHQLETSRRNLGVQTIDLYCLHNPEIELGFEARMTVLIRVKNLFAALEKCVEEGKISMYGVSTWNAFRTSSGSKSYISLEELLNYAKDAGGDNHHFKLVMAPLNLQLQDASNTPSQVIRGRRLPMLHAAAHLGIDVITTTPLFQGELVKDLNQEVKDKFPELGDERSPAQCALQFARTTPGVLATVAGMSKVCHVEENCRIIKCPGTSRG